jgi:hypothetical protein
MEQMNERNAMSDRSITVLAPYTGWTDGTLELDSPDGESGTLTLLVGETIIARGETFRAAQVGPSLLELSDGQLAGLFGSFLAHALESSEDGARDGWSILTDAAGDWADALYLMEEDEIA